MTFIKGQRCNLAVLDESESQAEIWQRFVMAGLTTQYLFTGSFPMRTIDVRKKWEDERRAGDINFSIRTPDGTFIGTCGLHGHRSIYRSWEFRILIFDPEAIGKGIGTEATAMLVNYAFERLNAHRVWLGVNAENIGAIKCYEKVGFKHEGALRDEIYCHGKYVDAVRMGILESEWACTKQ